MLICVLSLLGLLCLRTCATKIEKRTVRPEFIKAIGDILETAVIAGCFVFLICRPFIANAYHIESNSMLPTLKAQDVVVVNQLIGRFAMPNRNELIAFWPPSAKDLTSTEPITPFVKRVIATEGDIIYIHDGDVIVNGEKRVEQFVLQKAHYDLAPVLVPRGYVFVLGDNRSESNDSHLFGPIERNKIIGRVCCVCWPPSRLMRP